MAALTAPRDTKFQSNQPAARLLSYPVLANAVIFQGGMVALTAAGFAKAAAPTDSVVVGIATANVTGTAVNGGVDVPVQRGAVWLNNKAADLVVQADLALAPAAGHYGAPCYVDDDNTVRHTATGSIVAGVARRIGGTNGDPAGVLVEIGIG